MTAEAFAALLGSRRVRLGRWVAKCPSHQDSSPSLSIREAQDGRVLVYCFAGCRVAAILAALGLGSRDLFAGPPASPEQAVALRAARAARERTARAERKERHEASDRVRKWDAVVNALGFKLARAPEEALGQLFHKACGRLHEAETEAERWNPVRRMSAKDEEWSHEHTERATRRS